MAKDKILESIEKIVAPDELVLARDEEGGELEIIEMKEEGLYKPNENKSDPIQTIATSDAYRLLKQKNPNYSQAIRALNEQRDAKNGIRWTIDDENSVLIRDARNINSEVHYGYEAYAMQFLNSIRAAKILLGEGKNASKLDALAITFLNVVESEGYKNDQATNVATLKQANRALLDTYCTLANIDEKTALKQISVAKEFTSFEDEHFHVVTLSTIGGKTVFEADQMLLGLTDEQKAKYQSIEEDKQPPEWYTKLPTWEQDLVLHYMQEITGGKHVIPTQLRGDTVGIRNAYNKMTGIINEEGEVEILHQTFHGGTVSAQTKGDNQDIANMNVAQFAELADGPVHLVTLNSPFNPTGNDKDIVNQTAAAVGKINEGKDAKDHSVHSNLAFNALRRVGPNKYDGVRGVLARVANSVSYVRLRPIVDYLTGNGKQNPPRHFLEPKENDRPADLDAKALLRVAVDIKERISHNTSPFDSENRNLHITTLTSRLHNMISVMHEKHKPQENIRRKPKALKSHEYLIDWKALNPITSVFMCQSGKDRTGVQLFDTSSNVVENALPGTNAEEIRTALANGGHTQQMAGFQGGSMGCMGIKHETISAMPESWGKEVHDSLSQKTASFNKTLKTAKHAGPFAANSNVSPVIAKPKSKAFESEEEDFPELPFQTENSVNRKNSFEIEDEIEDKPESEIEIEDESEVSPSKKSVSYSSKKPVAPKQPLPEDSPPLASTSSPASKATKESSVNATRAIRDSDTIDAEIAKKAQRRKQLAKLSEENEKKETYPLLIKGAVLGIGLLAATAFPPIAIVAVILFTLLMLPDLFKMNEKNRLNDQTRQNETQLKSLEKEKSRSVEKAKEQAGKEPISKALKEEVQSTLPQAREGGETHQSRLKNTQTSQRQK